MLSSDKKFVRILVSIFTVMFVFGSITGCQSKSTSIVLDYGDEIAFENALNEGKNLEGKTVSFTALELRPNSEYGYNVWAGEHLNFVSERNPEIKVGDIVTVRATTVRSISGSWIINYEKEPNAVAGESTIYEEKKNTADAKTNEQTEETSIEPVVLDYGDALAFENALNDGNNLEGKTVLFVAKELHPDSSLGYNVWAGEHLNFLSDGDPGIEEGASVAVRIKKVKNNNGHWHLTYEKIDNVVVGTTTIISTPEDILNSIELPLKIVDFGFCCNSIIGDTAYVKFMAKVLNPNKKFAAEFPRVDITLRDPNGVIVGTAHQVEAMIMPEDTLLIIGTYLPIAASAYSDDLLCSMEASCSHMVKGINCARTDDFEFSNIKEWKGNEVYLTGEITNTTDRKIDEVTINLIFKKGDRVVYCAVLYLDDVKANQPTAFSFNAYGDRIPDYDSYEILAADRN